MLTSVIHTNATGVVKYHTHSLSKDDYFFTGKAIAGRFYGALAKELGCPAAVTKKAFSRLVHRKHPVTGKPLTKRNPVNARSAYEFVFSATKSVSLAMGLLGDRDILRMHRRAVHKAMKEVEKMAMVQTRITGRKVFLKTGKICYSKFDHLTSRPVISDDPKAEEKYLCDPQLHSHLIVNNITKFKGKYRALELSPLLKVLPHIEAVYHSELAYGLRQIGYEVERIGHKYEIKGFSRELIERFSQRTKQIEELAKKLNVKSAKAKAKLGGTSRLSKSKVREDVDLIKAWRKRLKPHEWLKIKSLKQDGPLPPKNEICADVAVQKALDHALEKNSTAVVQRVLGKALEFTYGTLRLEDVKTAFERNKNVFTAKVGYLQHCSSKELVWLENKIIEFAANGRNAVPPIHPSYEVKRKFLNEGQQKAIHTILNSTDRISILKGGAGTGKSTLLDEIRLACQEKDKPIFAVAPSSLASREVLRSKGFSTADTVAMLIKNKEIQAQIKNGILLIDESGLLSTKDFAKVIDISREQNSRILISGDPSQHKNPAAGSPMKLLIKKAGLPIARVDEILRQKNSPEYKRAISHLSKGHTRKGFAVLEKIGAVKEIADPEERYALLAKNYVSSIQIGRSALVVSPTNKENDEVTKHIRSEMKSGGRIGKKDKSHIILKSLNYSDADKSDFAKYEAGMVMQVHQNIKGGIKAGSSLEVLKADKTGISVRDQETGVKHSLDYDTTSRFDVFKEKEIHLTKGEHIRITRNSKDDRGKRLYNGGRYSIKGFSKSGEILLEGGRQLSAKFANIDYNYAITSHRSQGLDVKDIYVSNSSQSFAATNMRTAYVSYSRGSEKIMVVTDDKEALREMIARTGKEISATELKERHSKKNLDRNRRRDYARRIKQRTYGHSKSRYKEQLQKSIRGPRAGKLE